MAIRAEVELPIARPVEDVWAHLTDVDRYPEWLVASGVTRVEREPGPLGEGTRLRLEQRLGGRAAVLDGLVTAWAPPERFAFSARHPDGITLEATAALVPADGGCRIRWSLQVGLPLRLRLFESMAAPEVRRAATTDLLAFKRRLEQVAG